MDFKVRNLGVSKIGLGLYVQEVYILIENKYRMVLQQCQIYLKISECQKTRQIYYK